MVLDYAGARPNAARDPSVKLPLEEREEVEPPHADHVEAVAWLLPAAYVLGLLVLDATGARIGELAASDGSATSTRLERRWLVRAKSRRPVGRAGSSSPMISSASPSSGYPRARIATPKHPCSRSARRTASVWRSGGLAGMPACPRSRRTTSGIVGSACSITRACLGRDRRAVGQRNICVTADTYTHVLMDYREIDRAKLLKRVRARQTYRHTSELEDPSFAGTF